jgi:hypothetical protein
MTKIILGPAPTWLNEDLLRRYQYAYDLVDCLLDFLLTVHHAYGPQTRAAAQQFLKAANAYAYSHDD